MSPTWLSEAFLTIFLFGLIFTLVSLVLGVTHIGGLHLGHGHGAHAHGWHFHFGHGHIGHSHIGHAHGGHLSAGQGHVGSAGHAHGGGGHQLGGRFQPDLHIGGHKTAHAGDGTDGPGVLNMPTIMAFVTWFGGAGYIFTRTLGVGPWVAVPMALISGLTGGSIMFLLLARVLWRSLSQPLRSEDYRLPGTAARVVSPIRAGGVGEIVYAKGVSRFTAGARCVDEQAVAKGTEVVILRYERGIAYVQPVEDILRMREKEADVAGER